MRCPAFAAKAAAAPWYSCRPGPARTDVLVLQGAEAGGHQGGLAATATTRYLP